MYREGVSQYLDAKRIAARRVLGRQARGIGFRPRDLPSNGEIREALLRLVALAEGSDRTRRLFAMRIGALRLMHELSAWHPRLIGSVWSGHARRGSDIDLHLFADEVTDVDADLHQRGWRFEPEDVLIRVGDTFQRFHHLHLHDRAFPVELSVYPLAEQRRTTRSSTDGKPIDRVSAVRLEARIAEEHPEPWQRWLDAGGLSADRGERIALEGPWDEDDPLPGAFDGLLAELQPDP